MVMAASATLLVLGVVGAPTVMRRPAAADTASAIDPGDFTNPVANPYFPLTMGTVLHYRGSEDGNGFRERVAIKRAAPAGLSVQEYTPRDPKATAELAQVYQLAFAEKRASHGHPTRQPRPARGHSGQRPQRPASAQ